jgi:hypothetical protein
MNDLSPAYTADIGSNQLLVINSAIPPVIGQTSQRSDVAHAASVNQSIFRKR